ncbi:MAG: HD family phosphohydrolase [Desulfuromonas sp.]|nr:MAG: HD family phosphohydrolase [Desulfuromonas sp.]
MSQLKRKDAQQDKLSDLSRLLMTAAATASLYNPAHQLVRQLHRNAYNEIHLLFKEHEDITLKIIGDKLVFADKPVTKSAQTQRLTATLEKLGISFLKIKPGVTPEELLGLILNLGKSQGKQSSISNSEHIQYGKVEVRQQENQQLKLAEIAEIDAERVMDICRQARKRQKLEVDGIKEVVDGLVAAFSDKSDAFLAMAPLRAMDEYTYTHSTNVCILNLAQAKALGVEGQLLNDIGIAAMLHDIGKMFVPPEILAKPGKPTDEEWHILQQHPRMGAEYLLDTPGVPRLAVVTAYEHHMQYNNAGYPKSRHPWKVHLCSHMTAISDTYDAMRTRRPYEESLTQEKIMGIMKNLAGTKLHPQLTYSFLRLIIQLERNDHLLDSLGDGPQVH